MARRNRLEIIKDMLESIRKKEKIKTTKLLHQSNLSPQKFKEYLNELIEKDFIKEEKEKNNKYFILKRKGQEYLEKYISFSRFIENFGL